MQYGGVFFCYFLLTFHCFMTFKDTRINKIPPFTCFFFLAMPNPSLILMAKFCPSPNPLLVFFLLINGKIRYFYINLFMANFPIKGKNTLSLSLSLTHSLTLIAKWKINKKLKFCCWRKILKNQRKLDH